MTSATEIHEARILATLIAEPEKVSENLMERWIRDVDNWDLCDQCVLNLFWKTHLAIKKAKEWAKNPKAGEFVRRAGFALIAKFAMESKRSKIEKEIFKKFLKVIELGAFDERNFVKKAVLWALRQISKSILEKVYSRNEKRY